MTKILAQIPLNYVGRLGFPRRGLSYYITPGFQAQTPVDMTMPL